MTQTAYLYDDIYLQHETGWDHPECPERLTAINQKISAAPWSKNIIRVTPEITDISSLESRIARVHQTSYIKRARREIESGSPYLDTMDTVVCPASFNAALMAVEGCLKTASLIVEKMAANAFCAVRPPGHHAEADYAEGFCIFNNIAITARFLQNECGINKIAIVDWDVHHGNGTQHTFYDDDSVYYISLHQFPHFPGTGSIHEKGRGRGEGYTLNLPMSMGDGDSEYRHAFKTRIIPELEKYEPEFILISAGYDAHRADPLSSICLTTGMYHEMTAMLNGIARNFCKGRLMAILEGGYNLDALGNAVTKTLEAMIAE